MASEGRGKTALWLGLGALGVLVLLCGGALVGGVLWFQTEIEKLEALPPEEREAALAARLGLTDVEHAPTVDAFLAALDEGRVDEAHAMLSPELAAVVSRDELRKLQDAVDSTMGSYRSRSVRNLHVESVMGSPGPLVQYVYAAEYEQGDATLTIHVRELAGGTQLIHHYQVQSPRFVEALSGGDATETPAETSEPGEGD